MNAGSERIEYGYLIEAHTSGDIYVFFRDSNVLAVGDVASPARDPELDYFTGAWIGGRVDAMDRLLELSDDEDAHRARLRSGDEPRRAAGRARRDEDHLRPHGRSRPRGRLRRRHAQGRRDERAGPHVEGSAEVSLRPFTRVCGRITTSWTPMWCRAKVRSAKCRNASLVVLQSCALRAAPSSCARREVRARRSDSVRRSSSGAGDDRQGRRRQPDAA